MFSQYTKMLCYNFNSSIKTNNEKQSMQNILQECTIHTKDIHRPSPWTSSQAVGVAAGFRSSALMTGLYLRGKVVTLASWYSFAIQTTDNKITGRL